MNNKILLLGAVIFSLNYCSFSKKVTTKNAQRALVEHLSNTCVFFSDPFNEALCCKGLITPAFDRVVVQKLLDKGAVLKKALIEVLAKKSFIDMETMPEFLEALVATTILDYRSIIVHEVDSEGSDDEYIPVNQRKKISLKSVIESRETIDESAPLIKSQKSVSKKRYGIVTFFMCCCGRKPK